MVVILFAYEEAVEVILLYSSSDDLQLSGMGSRDSPLAQTGSNRQSFLTFAALCCSAAAAIATLGRSNAGDSRSYSQSLKRWPYQPTASPQHSSPLWRIRLARVVLEGL